TRYPCSPSPPRSAPGLRDHLLPDRPEPDVVRTTTTENSEPPAQLRVRPSQHTQLRTRATGQVADDQLLHRHAPRIDHARPRLSTRPLPNPLADCTPATLIDLGGRQHLARKLADLPPLYQEIADAWDKTLRESAELAAMDDALRRRDVTTIKAVWDRLVAALD